MTVKETIEQIIALDEKISSLRDELAQCPVEEQERELIARFGELLDKTKEDDTVEVGLIRIADLLLSLSTPAAVLSVGQGLGHANEDVRFLAGDAILHLAGDGIDKIMPLVDEAFKKGARVSEELPYLLMDTGAPEARGILERFLGHENPEVVANTMECIAELDEPEAIEALEKLTTDERTVTAEVDGVDKAKWTIGQLAKEAIEMLSDKED